MTLQLLIVVDLLNVDSSSEVNFTGDECLCLRIQIAHDLEFDRLQLYVVCIRIVFALAQRNGILDVDAGDLKCTVGNDRIVRRCVLCPFRAAWIGTDLILLDRIEYGVRQHGCEVWRSHLQSDLDRRVIDGTYAHVGIQILHVRIWVAVFTGRTGDITIHEVCIVAFGRHGTLPGPYEVLCSQWRTIAPCQTVFQLDRIRQTIFTDRRQILCQIGNDVTVFVQLVKSVIALCQDV